MTPCRCNGRAYASLFGNVEFNTANRRNRGQRETARFGADHVRRLVAVHIDSEPGHEGIARPAQILFQVTANYFCRIKRQQNCFMIAGPLGAIMDAYFMIVAWAVLAMFVIAHTESTRDQKSGHVARTGDCSGQVAGADNGIGQGVAHRS